MQAQARSNGLGFSFSILNSIFQCKSIGLNQAVLAIAAVRTRRLTYTEILSSKSKTKYLGSSIKKMIGWRSWHTTAHPVLRVRRSLGGRQEPLPLRALLE